MTIENGYLDIGINDTMKDLFVNFLGAIIFSIFGYFYLLNNKQDNHIIKNFVDLFDDSVNDIVSTLVK